jgi:hypothetical protein
MHNRYALALVIALLALAQEGLSSSQYDYADQWKSWSNAGRDAYLQGFVDGNSEAFITAGKDWLPKEFFHSPQSKRVKAVASKLFLIFDAAAIRDVVTDLYADPANRYINFTRMVHIARDKLKGADYAQQLREARKQVFDEQRLREQLEPR